jgi:outer membrane protein assembly factor BamB
MARPRRFAILFLSALLLSFCAAPAKKPLVDPFPLRFPLVEVGTLEIEGHVVGQPRAGDGIVYFTTREGYLTAVLTSARAVWSRFKAEHPMSKSPVIVGDTVLLHDDADVFYVLTNRGRGTVAKYELDPGCVATTPVRLVAGGFLFGTADGRGISLAAWEYRPAGPAAEVTCGPVPVWSDGGLKSVLFGRSDGLFMAIGAKGHSVWEFRAESAIQAEPTLHRGHVYFGDSKRMFYCLDAATGKRIWSRRLQGAALYPAVISDGIVAVAASNSVVYRLSAKGGSILSWEAIPSRIVYEPASAGSLTLLTWAGPTVVALDLPSGKRAGQYDVSGVLAAGAVWSPPHVVLFVEDPESGRQRIVFLRSR